MASRLKLNGTVINKCWQIRQGPVVVIILLYALTTISIATNWSNFDSQFIKNGQNFWTVYTMINPLAIFLVESVTSSMSTIITDLYMVCAIQWELYISAHHYSNSRFGAAGWSGDSAGPLFYFHYFS